MAVASLARPVATPGSTLAAALEHGTVGVTALLQPEHSAAEAFPPDRDVVEALSRRLAERWLHEQPPEREAGWELF